MTRLVDQFIAKGVRFGDGAEALNPLLERLQPDRRLHLAILQRPYLELIAAGEKTVESRFRMNHSVPFGKVAVGDLVLLKHPGEPVSHFFWASTVNDIRLDWRRLAFIKDRYGEQIAPVDPADFWADQEEKRYCTLVGVGEHGVVELSVSVEKRSPAGWVTFARRDVANTYDTEEQHLL